MSRRLILILVFLLVFTIINTIFSGKSTEKEQLNQGEISLISTKTSYKREKEVIFTVKNNLTQEIQFPTNCPFPPLEIVYYQNGQWQNINPQAQIDCRQFDQNFKVAAGQEITLSLLNWKYQLFSGLGRYEARLNLEINGAPKTFISNEFTIEKESFLSVIWKHALYRPIYNTLIFLTYIASHNLGIGIMLLTILIRTLLLIPSQKALKSQKHLQEIQPKLEAIKKKYKDNQERIAQETLKIWKENKVNPFGSCLPILIQFPILIALFYVIKDGLLPGNVVLLYEPLKHISLSEINTHFLALNLTKVNPIVLPLIVGGLQFIQIKLQLAKKKDPQSVESKKDPKKKTAAPDMQIVNQTMLYFMPAMIAIFTASVPAGVGLYWGISTVYGICQQVFVNLQHEKKKSI